MLRYRSFRNTDPPALAEVWRSRSGQRGLLQPISVDFFEQYVFGRLHFDYPGLILAWDDDRPIGFAHAAFGPNESETAVSTDYGVTCLVLVRPDVPEKTVTRELLTRSEKYLRRRGAKVLYGGGINPLNPFYLGMYGGSELPGILASDTTNQELFRSCGYQEIDRVAILRLELAAFRPPIDRKQLQLRRRTTVEVTFDPPARSWWDACVTGNFDLTRFELMPRGGGAPPFAGGTIRTMAPMTGMGTQPAVGLLHLETAPAHRRQGMATLLLSEVFQQLGREGVGSVEAQTPCHNTAALGLYTKLGFTQVDEGTVFRKRAHEGGGL